MILFASSISNGGRERLASDSAMFWPPKFHLNASGGGEKVTLTQCLVSIQNVIGFTTLTSPDRTSKPCYDRGFILAGYGRQWIGKGGENETN